MFFLTETSPAGWEPPDGDSPQRPPVVSSNENCNRKGKALDRDNYDNNKNERRPIRNQRWGNLSAVPEG